MLIFIESLCASAKSLFFRIYFLFISISFILLNICLTFAYFSLSIYYFQTTFRSHCYLDSSIFQKTYYICMCLIIGDKFHVTREIIAWQKHSLPYTYIRTHTYKCMYREEKRLSKCGLAEKGVKHPNGHYTIQLFIYICICACVHVRMRTNLFVLPILRALLLSSNELAAVHLSDFL